MIYLLKSLCLSLLLGSLVALLRYNLPSYPTPEFRPGITPSLFLNQVRNFPDSLHDVIIYPPLNNKNFVQGTLHIQNTPDRLFQFNAPIPFQLGPPPHSDIRAYLAKNHPTFSYHYAWQTTPTAQALLWSIPTFLLSTLYLLTLGRRLLTSTTPSLLPPPSTTSTPAPTTLPSPTPEQLALLDSLNATLEQSLQQSPEEPSSSSPEPPSSPIRSLSNTPEDPTPLSTPDNPKDYQGTYYPVARPTTPKSNTH